MNLLSRHWKELQEEKGVMHLTVMKPWQKMLMDLKIHENILFIFWFCSAV